MMQFWNWNLCLTRGSNIVFDPRKQTFHLLHMHATKLECFHLTNFFPFQNYLRVIYKGYGKTPKDASSVRATHFIPASCGLYYYEVKIISKGRDGYMGIGLSMQQVSTNRLPGWDKLSYGYHGDDGNAFCGSGTGTVSSSLSNNPDF